MLLEIWDWIIIAAYFALSLGIGLFYAKRAGKNTDEFFLGGRNMPWALAGLSMVATTFAADTPLAVTELVANHGVAGNWLWWNMLIGGMLTTFFFARMWRRSGVQTEIELIELRYNGVQASFLRGFKAVYLGLIMNALIIGWVNVALNSILSVFFGIPEEQVIYYTFAAMLLTAGYSALSGLWGVAVTDAVQFIIAMTGCIILAVLVVQSPEIGGMEGLIQKVPASSIEFFPAIDSGAGIGGHLNITLGAFFAFIGVQWWASWYPGAEPGGGGYVAQRMMSTRSEKDALFSTLFFQVAHYALRPWPWIIVGLCSLVIYPDLPVADKKLGYVMAMKDYLPVGLRGLLLVAFFAAYMSTIATQLNWGASYLVNDLYKRFMAPANRFSSEAEAEKKYVAVARWITLLLMVVGAVVTTQIKTISGVWEFIIECGAGLGLVLILRWYWWRINAWSEITATLVPFLVYGICKIWIEPMAGEGFAANKGSFFVTVAVTTLSWLLVTFMTKPVDTAHLQRFYQVVRPGGNWGPFVKDSGIKASGGMGSLLLCWVFAILMTYGCLFTFGSLLFARYDDALIWLGITVVSMLVVRHYTLKTNLLEN